MPRAALALSTGTDAGTLVGVGAAIDPLGGIVPPNSIVFIHNGGGVSLTVTAITPTGATAVPAGLDLPDRALVIPAGQYGVMGPFAPEFYGQISGGSVGQVFLDFSVVASVKAFAVQLTR